MARKEEPRTKMKTRTSDSGSRQLLEVARVGCKDEYTDHLTYKRLSDPRIARSTNFSEILSGLSATEYKHYEFWKRYLPEFQVKASSLRVNLIVLLRVLFGLTFAVRYLDRHEASVIRQYKAVADMIPPEDRAAFDEMLRDEEEHETEFSKKIETSSVHYISFVVLGLADALVEITGIHAGSLGIYNSTEIAGLAGVVAGAAASLAMSSAAFAQAKQGFTGSARLSAIYTGVSYFITAVILATPYFLTPSLLTALSVSLVLAVVIVASITYYSSVISGKGFSRDFLEILGIMFGTTVVLYILGYFIRVALGISI